MPQQVPAGDGGLALGQAVIACARLQHPGFSLTHKDYHDKP